ncbi:MAG TPA: hypothetical protein VFW96_21820, partial [Thermomicrobiales bacterium]|nr:hypothetical protein [Thermomicrobiales bacterium]
LVYLAGRGARTGRRAVQREHLALAVIADGVVTFADGRRRAVLEVGSVDFAALGPDRQRELVAGYGAALAGLAHPVQVLVRAVPLDLTSYLAEREARVRREPHDRLRRLSRDRAAFLRRLAGGRTFLDRRCYLIVPADDPRPAARFRPWRRRGMAAPVNPTADEAAAAVRQLAARCDDLASQLGRCGLAARRLGDGELAELVYACWCPDLAQIQRLRRDLHDDARLVVARAATGAPRERMAPRWPLS